MKTTLAALAFAASLAAPSFAQTSTAPAPGTQVLSVVCGEKQNVVSWKLLEKRNSNSLLRSVDGATNDWICGGPHSIAPCTDLNVNVFIDKNVVPGKVYRYTQKSAPACASNSVTCPSGASSGAACTTGGIAAPSAPSAGPAGGSGGSAGGPVSDADMNCTGGHPDCICVKNVGAYNRYESAAAVAIQMAFPTAESKPAGMSDATATAAICAAYNANKTLGAGSVCRAQADEIVFEDPNSPNSAYPTISVDVVTGGGAFWRNSIAACARGVQ